MKKLAWLAVGLFLLIVSPSASNAAGVKTYNNPVQVLLYKGTSVTVAVEGNYQIVNKETLTITPLPSGTNLTFRSSSSTVFVTYNGKTDFSSTGFTIQETIGAAPLSLVKVNQTRYRGSVDIRLQNSALYVVNILDMEDYLKGVVPSEMPASWPLEALKAQAIAARNYAYKHKTSLTTNPNTQTYKGYDGESPRSNEAVEATRGLYLKYNGNVIETYYHSTSGGRTANVSDVWNSSQTAYPYLASVDDPYESSPYSRWSFTFSPSVLLRSFGITDPSVVLYDVSIAKTGANGEVGAVTIETSAGEKTVKGNETTIRKLFPLDGNQFYGILPSNWFDIQVQKSGPSVSIQTTSGNIAASSLSSYSVQTGNGTVSLADVEGIKVQTTDGIVPLSASPSEVNSIIVTGKGWGHRIGMSQYGAKAFAERGWTAEQILEHYFRGAEVSFE
ncbi:SpoIID/LytB domain-containing protein [Geobacillus proteiniphilus]|uniref:SpoIID/LytB domain-containing protein n=1 Tax=Geobacillus proteiniphilus TaxID=860353 RepID=A0ABY9MEW4_9BACL|nr:MULTISPECIES: SpoIID/LytB domain-containing protein [Geobacillus]OPX02892.1 sporulation protein SpoIID [Geobacillus sp. LEMMY01]WMJ16535.1 SpoIID/LytB domain-containing protein [Geobacillus proteiniphilus]